MTIYILLFTIVISIYALQSPQAMDKLIFNPYMVNTRKEWFRFFSSGFIHADWIHLIFNMIVLYSFGSFVENTYLNVFDSKGLLYFIVLYLGGMLIAVIPTYEKHKHDPYYNSLGASGAVSAVLFASIVFAPWQKIALFGFIKLPAILFGVLYLIYSYQMSRKSSDNINHDAHFWGSVFGMVYTLLLKPSLFSYFFQELMSPSFR